MFIKIGNRWLNTVNIAYIEQVGEQFKCYMTPNENAPLNFSASNYADTSYHDMKAWLKQQEAPELART